MNVVFEATTAFFFFLIGKFEASIARFNLKLKFSPSPFAVAWVDKTYLPIKEKRPGLLQEVFTCSHTYVSHISY